jgi:hypothetical protein
MACGKENIQEKHGKSELSQGNVQGFQDNCDDPDGKIN